MSSNTSRRRRALVVLPASGALLASAMIGLPAQAAVTGPIDCPEPLPTSQAVKGLTGTGYSVSSGTTPDAFTATVLGRITNGIAPGVDMIMAELDSPALDAAGGIWAGMSGSPVYTADGHLIGAVAYGLAASSPIGGITPATTMVPLLTGGTPTSGSNSTVKLPQTIKVNRTQATTLSKAGGVSEATAMRGFNQLTIPLSVSGHPSKSGLKILDRFAKKAGRVSLFSGGSTAKATVTPTAVADVHAAGNFAGVLSYGDVSWAGLGTTTFVCKGRAVAFGHPFSYEGDTKLGANLADTLYIQPDPLNGPSKIANITDTVGTVNFDSLTGIAATLGAAPTGLVPFTSKLTAGGKTYTGSSKVAATDLVADVAAYSTLYNVERALGSSGKGSGTVTITIKGKRANGTAFTLTRPDKYVDRSSLPFAVANATYGLLISLTDHDLEKITITSVDVTGSVSRTVKGYKASKLQIRKRGVWRSPSDVILVLSGGKVTTRVTLTSLETGKSKYVKLSVPIARVGSDALGNVAVSAGSDPYEWDFSDAASFPELLQDLRAIPPSNVIVGETSFESGPGSYKTARRVTGLAILPFWNSADLYTR